MTPQDPGVLPLHGLSHVRGAAQPPLSVRTIPGLFRETVTRFGDREAVVFGEQGVRWTWRQFLVEVDRLAAGLRALGLRRGDRLGIWSPNRVEWLVTQFATARVGIVLVNINPSYRLSELEYALQLSGCRAVVAAERLRTADYLAMLQAVAPKLPALEFIIRMGEGETPGMHRYADVLAAPEAVDVAALDTIEATLGCFDPINIQFTSGTTGHPKGATLTHHNVVNNAIAVAAAMRFTAADKLCIPVPLYHCFGMVLAVLACVSSGAAMVPGRDLRRGRDIGRRVRRGLHCAARRADDVHRRAGPSRFRHL